MQTDGLIVNGIALLFESTSLYGFSESSRHMSTQSPAIISFNISNNNEILYACPAELPNFNPLHIIDWRCRNESNGAAYTSRFSAIDLPCYDDYDGGICAYMGACHYNYSYVGNTHFPFVCNNYSFGSGNVVDVFTDVRGMQRRRVMDKCEKSSNKKKMFALVVTEKLTGGTRTERQCVEECP